MCTGTSANSPTSLLKNAHLRRSPHLSSLRRTSKYASLLRISGALHLGIFEQPDGIGFFSNLLLDKEEDGRCNGKKAGGRAEGDAS
jgi:hypothetical protein